MWITPKPFGAPAILGFWACGKAWDAPGIFWGKRHFGAPARGFWRRGGRAGRQPPGGNAEPRPQKGDFGRPKSGYPHYPQKRFPPKVEKKAQQLPGFWRRAHKLSTRLSTDRSAPPGASAQPQNRPKRGEKVYPATLYHTLPAHANKRMVGRTGRVLPRRADNGQRYIFYIFCVREMHIRGRRRMHQLRLAERSNYRTSAAADPGTPPG